MPIYEYRCETCKAVFEDFEFSARPEEKKTCPACGSTDTVRTVSTFSSASAGGKAQASGGSCGSGGGGRFT